MKLWLKGFFTIAVSSSRCVEAACYPSTLVYFCLSTRLLFSPLCARTTAGRASHVSLQQATNIGYNTRSLCCTSTTPLLAPTSRLDITPQQHCEQRSSHSLQPRHNSAPQHRTLAGSNNQQQMHV